MASKEQLRKIREKYHLGEYRNKKSRSTITKGVKKMARRRKSRGFRGRVKSYSRGHKSGLGVTALVLGGGIYGALRSYISSAIAPLTSKLPLGNVADNVGMGIISYLAYKKGSGIIKNAGMVGLGIESAMAAQDLIAGGLGSITGGQTASGNIF
jgi:fluoride ion exporter CrcB/FEX